MAKSDGASVPMAGLQPIEDRLREAGLPTLPRLTWLEVDLSILEANARLLRAALPTATGLVAVVKADGYGHGLLAAAHASLAGGVEMLAVATLDEALELRRAGFTAPILMLYAVPPAALPEAVAAHLDLVAMDHDSLEALAALIERSDASGSLPRVHLGIDTGMTRGGFPPGEAVSAAKRLLAAGLPQLSGTWSHLASPEDVNATARQVASFRAALGLLEASGIAPGRRHLDATGGLLAQAAPPWDMVRIGLALYGHLPGDIEATGPSAALLAGLRPALTLRARAASVETVDPGTSVGYGGTWTALRTSRIATIALGYADGWTRLYANGSTARVRRQSVPLVGRVGSDAVALDVTDVAGFSAADEITLLSPDNDGASTVDELARRRGSISWEVLDDFTPRLSRVYVQGGVAVAVRYLDGQLVTGAGFLPCLAPVVGSESALG